MKISTKARYAVMAMLELALNENQGPINLTDISRAQGISLSYLEQLFASLRKSGLVKGRRGPGGGYRLARPASEIPVADVVNAVSDKSSMQGHYPGESVYRPADLWDKLSNRIEHFLSDISLADCVADGEASSDSVLHRHAG